MGKLENALKLAAFGFYVFPVTANKKSPPAFDGWQDGATRDPAVIRSLWSNPATDFNIGISTSKFGDGEALIVVDVDNKNGGQGDAELLRLEIEGWDLPRTFTQITPTGGRHLVFSHSAPVRQSAGILARNIDIRSRGGYIVADGSTLPSGCYRADYHPITPAPQWLIDKCGSSRTRSEVPKTVDIEIDQTRAQHRVEHYLINEAPAAVEGQGGDDCTYRVACRVKDFGVNPELAYLWMFKFWNPRCSPPWSAEELKAKVDHAYKYGAAPIGIAAPEVDFKEPYKEPIPQAKRLHPFEELNQEYAFCLAGGGAHILWETRDAGDRYHLEHLTMSAFHAKFANRRMEIGKRDRPISELWMEDKGRRAYDGIVFYPKQDAPPRFFNLWRGFAYEPAEPGSTHPALNLFLEHARNNVCNGDEALCDWLLGYFAHLIQRPWDKPLVALVFKGSKGVGKNALIERIGALLGSHFLLTSNRRYLVGNFNGHLENCLLFALDEAFWSGDKQAEGTLKDLITGREHVIEHKGKEPYTVANKTRVVIIGNEDWLVPASHDERRFAVFKVGEGRKQDRKFFTEMREGMERGGYSSLLRFLQEYNLSGIDVNAAPITEGLREQKESTLDPFRQWWLDSLEEGRIIGAEFTEWPATMECERFRDAFRRYVKARQITSRIPEDRVTGRLLKSCAPSVEKKRASRQIEGAQPYIYHLPELLTARTEWEAFMGHKHHWEPITGLDDKSHSEGLRPSPAHSRVFE